MSPKKSTTRKKQQKKTTKKNDSDLFTMIFNGLSISSNILSLLLSTVYFWLLYAILHEAPIAKITIKKLSWAQRFFGIEPEKIVTTTYVAKEVKDAVLWSVFFSFIFRVFEIIVQVFPPLKKKNIVSAILVLINGTYKLIEDRDSYISKILKELPDNIVIPEKFWDKMNYAHYLYDIGLLFSHFSIMISIAYVLYNAFNWIKKISKKMNLS